MTHNDKLHPEDIRAELRKRFGSIFAFEDAAGLERKSVSDFLRGRPSWPVKVAIAKVLGLNTSDLEHISANQRIMPAIRKRRRLAA